MFGFELAKNMANRAGGRALDTARYLGQRAGQRGAIHNIEDVDRNNLQVTVAAEVIELSLPASETETDAIAASLGRHLVQLAEHGGYYTPVTRTEHDALRQVAKRSGVLIDGQTVNIPEPRSPL